MLSENNRSTANVTLLQQPEQAASQTPPVNVGTGKPLAPAAGVCGLDALIQEVEMEGQASTGVPGLANYKPGRIG